MDGEPVFDEIIHAPVRLRICGLLRHLDEIEFAVLRETLMISDAELVQAPEGAPRRRLYFDREEPVVRSL